MNQKQLEQKEKILNERAELLDKLKEALKHKEKLLNKQIRELKNWVKNAKDR